MRDMPCGMRRGAHETSHAVRNAAGGARSVVYGVRDVVGSVPREVRDSVKYAT